MLMTFLRLEIHRIFDLNSYIFDFLPLAFLGFGTFNFKGRHRGRSLIIEACLAVAEDGVAHQATPMADAIVLLAVVPAAIASFSNGVRNGLLLLFPDRNSFLGLVVFTADALAGRIAAQPLLQADAVELAALATFAVASSQASLLRLLLLNSRLWFMLGMIFDKLF